MRKLTLLLLLLIPSVSFAVSPSVESDLAVVDSTSSSTTHTGNYPATVDNGDILVTCVSVRINSSSTDTMTITGHTELDFSGVSSNSALGAFYEVMDGTEDGGTFTVTLSTASPAVIKSWAIPAEQLTGTPEFAVSGGTGTSHDPSSVTPAGGSDDYLSLACAETDKDRTYSAFPSSYSATGQQQSGAGFGTSTTLAWATRQWTGTSEDPGAFTSNTSDDWRTAHIVISPTSSSSPTLSDSTPEAGTTDLDITLSAAFGAGGNPTGGTITINGESETFTCGNVPDSTSCDDVALPLADFSDTGAFNSLEWGVQGTITVTNGTETTSAADITIDVPSAGLMVTVACDSDDTPTPCDTGTEVTTPIEQGDFLAVVPTSGASLEPAPQGLTTHGQPFFDGPTAEYQVLQYDLTANSWLEQNSAALNPQTETCDMGIDENVIQPVIQAVTHEVICE